MKHVRPWPSLWSRPATKEVKHTTYKTLQNAVLVCNHLFLHKALDVECKFGQNSKISHYLIICQFEASWWPRGPGFHVSLVIVDKSFISQNAGAKFQEPLENYQPNCGRQGWFQKCEIPESPDFAQFLTTAVTWSWEVLKYLLKFCDLLFFRTKTHFSDDLCGG